MYSYIYDPTSSVVFCFFSIQGQPFTTRTFWWFKQHQIKDKQKSFAHNTRPPTSSHRRPSSASRCIDQPTFLLRRGRILATPWSTKNRLVTPGLKSVQAPRLSRMVQRVKQPMMRSFESIRLLSIDLNVWYMLLYCVQRRLYPRLPTSSWLKKNKTRWEMRWESVWQPTFFFHRSLCTNNFMSV